MATLLDLKARTPRQIFTGVEVESVVELVDSTTELAVSTTDSKIVSRLPLLLNMHINYVPIGIGGWKSADY